VVVEVIRLDRHAWDCRVVSQTVGPPRTCPSIVLGQSLLKGDRMDWVIQKATELGVAGITPLVTDHAVVRPRAGRVTTQRARWQRIALEAAQQSERWDVPNILDPVPVADFLRTHREHGGRLMLCERDGGVPVGAVPLPQDREASIVLLVGPEGGWREQEVATAQRHGFQPVTLGERILRAETAALAALSVIQHRLGELG
jgi:16S rRNA (uracil1498-N3)-methyltransferase